MKLKGIPIYEQHVEKLLLGVALLGLLGVAAWQFISHPNTVDMGSKKGVEPGQVDAILKERADAVAQQLRDDARPEPDPFDRAIPKVSDRFEQALAQGTAGPDTLPRVTTGIGNRLLPIDLGTDTWYYVPSIPAPTILAKVMQTADALSDAAVQRYPELAARFPDPTAPKDIVWTTPAAVINPSAILAELRRSDANSKPPQSQVPTPWFNDSLYVVDVVFEREELLPDGTWGKLAIVDPIPSQVTFRPRLTATADADLKNDIFARLADRPTQQALLQPDFLETGNDSFVPPALPSAAPVAEENDQADQLAELIGRLKADRTKKADELKSIGGPLEDAKDKDRDKDKDKDKGGDKGGGGLAPPGGGGGLGGGLSGGDRGGRVDGADAEKTKARRIGLTKALRQLDDRIARFEAELKEENPEATVETRNAGGINLAGDEPIIVWAHDIGVVPGKTYRYRSQLRVFNPFFTRMRQLVKEQQSLASNIVLAGKPSDWSKPVEVTPPVAFYITRASPGDGPLGLGNVRVEVYRLHGGKWRLEEFTASPGDRIGRVVESLRSAPKSEAPKGAKAPPAGGAAGGAAAGAGAAPAAIASGPVDFSTDWYIVDIIEDQTGERRGLAEGQKPAIVVIERIGGGGRTEIRDPARDADDEDRKRLFRDWRLGSLG